MKTLQGMPVSIGEPKVEGPLKQQITNPLARGFDESIFIFAQDELR